MPSSGVLIALAEALGVSVEYLTSDQDLVLEAVEFRKKAISRQRGSPPRGALSCDGGATCAADHQLEQASRGALSDSDDLAEVEHAALRLHTHWNLGRNPISSMVELLEECGITVLAFRRDRCSHEPERHVAPNPKLNARRVSTCFTNPSPMSAPSACLTGTYG